MVKVHLCGGMGEEGGRRAVGEAEGGRTKEDQGGTANPG